MRKAQRSAISSDLIAVVRREFTRLDWNGDHGCRHWARVRLHGIAIATSLRASVRVVELFAFLHDARRHDEWGDPRHGPRSAELVHELGAAWLGISRAEEELLAHACRHHSDGRLDGEPTVQACWDADRLDLARVGIAPEPHRLCTDAARDLLRAHPAWFRPRPRARWSDHRASRR
jgi:uncharacterized protein